MSGVVVDARAALLDARSAAREGLAGGRAETHLAGIVAAGAGLELPAGAVAILVPGRPGDELTLHGQRLSGRATRVPWARDAQWLVACVEAPEKGAQLVVVPTADAQVSEHENVAGEPRDDVIVDAPVPAERAAPVPREGGEWTRRCGALVRAAQLAGACEAVCELALAHGAERVQFGRPINRFQAVQAHLVRIASETASAGIAVDLAMSCLPESPLPEIAVAKIRTGRAATIVARHAHQVLGAIGTTELHALGWWTRRLWAWRDEYGGERYWSHQLGSRLAEGGPGTLWGTLVTLGEP